MSGARLQRAKWRSRRGMRELDVLLNRFIETCYAELNAAERDDFDALLVESDVDLYAWFTGRAVPDSTVFVPLVTRIRQCGD